MKTIYSNQNSDDLYKLSKSELISIITSAVQNALKEEKKNRKTFEIQNVAKNILALLNIDEHTETFFTALQKTWNETKIRLRGEYSTDKFGFDEQYLKIFSSILEFLYRKYFRCSVQGLNHIPNKGNAIIVANHGGILPWDIIMLKLAVLYEHPEARNVRGLYSKWFNKIPLINDFLQKSGNLPYSKQNVSNLLEQKKIIAVFPEGLAGEKKLYNQRYILQPFQNRDFIRQALHFKLPIIPCAIIGSEDTYPLISRIDWMGKLFGLPYYPITPQSPGFPTFLSTIPLPVKWNIVFSKPLSLNYSNRNIETEELYIDYVNTILQNNIQSELNQLVSHRNSIFKG